MNHRKKHPNRQGPRDYMCKGYKGMGNSRKWWGSAFHHDPVKSERKREAELQREAWA